MTFQEAVTRFDALKYNTYSDAEKFFWLFNLEMEIFFEIYAKYEDTPKELAGYDESTMRERKLQVSAPHDVLYLRYLEAMVDYHNGEIEKYNNSISLFEAAWQAYARYINRTHMPMGYSWNFQ